MYNFFSAYLPTNLRWICHADLGINSLPVVLHPEIYHLPGLIVVGDHHADDEP